MRAHKEIELPILPGTRWQSPGLEEKASPGIIDNLTMHLSVHNDKAFPAMQRGDDCCIAAATYKTSGVQKPVS